MKLKNQLKVFNKSELAIISALMHRLWDINTRLGMIEAGTKEDNKLMKEARRINKHLKIFGFTWGQELFTDLASAWIGSKVYNPTGIFC